MVWPAISFKAGPHLYSNRAVKHKPQAAKLPERNHLCRAVRTKPSPDVGFTRLVVAQGSRNHPLRKKKRTPQKMRGTKKEEDS